LDRLIPHSGLPAETNNWEVHVIQDEQKNAFVIPGGKVFVFSGILEVTQNEAGLAAVLGHEIAHNVAHHSAERMSSYVVFLPVALVASLLLQMGDIGDLITRTVVDLAFLRPGSRKQEVSDAGPLNISSRSTN
jgi:predicted Zn-dependent protease